MAAASDDEVLGDGIVSSERGGGVMELVGKDKDEAYGYHAVSAGSEPGRVVVSFAVGRRTGGLGSLEDVVARGVSIMLAVKREVSRTPESGLERGNIEAGVRWKGAM